MAEQLDRAAVELRLDHPIHNRLAIILIDNAVELMAKEALFVHTAIGGDYCGITAKHRKMARSRNLHQQLAVLTFVGELTPLEAEFVLAAHDHRNSAYHEGYAGEPYQRQLAFLYYEFACSYVARFTKAFYSWSSNFQYTEIGRRYHEATSDSDQLLGKIDRAKLAAMLLNQLPDPSAISEAANVLPITMELATTAMTANTANLVASPKCPRVRATAAQIASVSSRPGPIS
ncbi:hypothetical protein [Novosphingobium guangzhouense]|nr:hypothetical protein [Novosphingobium guangzhouense]